MTTQRIKNRYAANATARLTDTPLDRELVIQGSDNTLWRGDGVTAGGIAITVVGAGSVTSVGFSAPSIFTVTGSPVTTSGTISLTLATQAAGTAFAGPVSGAAAVPTFRPLYETDIALSLITDQSGASLTGQALDPLESNSYGFTISWNKVTGKPTTLAGYGITDNVFIVGSMPYFPPYPIASVLGGNPPASLNIYKAIYVTGLTGGDEPCVSDGTNWRRFSDRSIAN